MSTIKLHQLQALVASAEAGSIRGAARTLGLSQAAVTRALRELEASERLPLLVRAPEGIGFTEYGKTLLTHAKLVLKQLEHAQSDLERMRGRVEGRLSVGVTPWLTMTFLAETVLRFRERMPDVRLELYEALMAVAQPLLRDGSMDFALGHVQPGSGAQEFAFEPLLRYDTSVMVRAGHPRERAKSVHDLLDCDWVLNSSPDGQAALVDYLFTRHGAQIDERRIVRAQSVAMLQTMLEQAGMCTWCPTILAAVPPFGERMRVLSLKETFEPSELGIVTRRSSTLSDAARCFIDCLLQTIRRHARSARKEDLALFRTLTLLI
ncbi:MULTISPECIES: LysR substrate-binding domain-containing protein [Burkholderia]|jgi:DNA-binding transcriptional LysR family regulator|uniref:Transcriptional regulator, LysR family n=1 Tax=Burkholderia ambifaria (strain ATCC BAA-244 / DSM 16087 / CCUG 44356 / LMG 19182 / AMMD) TaxID=339670 RepID=Q0B1W1_BURCM|nr:LysR substrate-binding domain-containing protein [Burkholderia ambifaria]ABI91862.1 transcriptional regulator, LysR family [Burkholderia ambifaria AMMD]AJY26280.1 bacterial regulatory helix-turn-helix, lysR family protein [Burkholderia ambifaria AMMD]MBR7932501.1 LysR family transcriptional regulator [Burkholderia ambifaria]MBR8186624.1 LysR family transcriptional regulator [Burkholderia ambifaria]MBR8334245.1 LysR family transcriptional regulator [Burkholderia ambifaria]